MADSIAPQALTADVKKDIYAATGIAKTSGLEIQNIGASAVYCAILLAEPTNQIAKALAPGQSFQVDANSSGFWAWSNVVDGLITVQEV